MVGERLNTQILVDLPVTKVPRGAENKEALKLTYAYYIGVDYTFVGCLGLEPQNFGLDSEILYILVPNLIRA